MRVVNPSTFYGPSYDLLLLILLPLVVASFETIFFLNK